MKINNKLAYVLGVILLSIGIVLAVKSNLGITVSTCPPYILNQKISKISFGTFSYIVQGIVFLLMIIVLRRFKIKFLLSFLTSVILGYSIDLFTYLMNGIQIVGIYTRLIILVMSILIASLGVVLFMKSGLPILPFDMFVQEVSKQFNIKIGMLKTFFDLSTLTISIIMSFLFFGELRAVGIGTVLSALIIGPTVGFIMKWFNKNIKIVGIKYSKKSN